MEKGKIMFTREGENEGNGEVIDVDSTIDRPLLPGELQP